MYLPLGIILGKSIAPPKWVVEGERKIGGVPVGGYGVDVVVGCCVGLHWNVGDACKSWLHICGSWYLPRFLLRGS